MTIGQVKQIKTISELTSRLVSSDNRRKQILVKEPVTRVDGETKREIDKFLNNKSGTIIILKD